MLIELNKNEFEVASKLIKGGFASAKDTFEQILQTPIAIQRIDDDEYAIKRLVLHGGQRAHVLKTELKGELSGSCYLLFTDEEVNNIMKTCLPESIIADESNDGHQARMEFLKEMDNMVAAAVVTQFANYLGILLYGDVPELESMKLNAIDDYLEGEAMKFDAILHFKAIFNGPELAISPHFVWMFQNELLVKIKEIFNETTIN